MAQPKNAVREMEPLWMGLLKRLIEVMGVGRQFVESVIGLLEKRVEKFQQRFMRLLAAYLGIFAGLLFVLLGMFYLLIDLAGVPRGVVFTAGGFLVLLISSFVILVNKK